MTNACYTARATTQANVKELISNLSLPKNMMGQYQHDERMMGTLFNPLDPGKGMTKLMEETPNALNSIKSTDVVTIAQILSKSAAETRALKTRTGMDETLVITTRSDAQEEADQRTLTHQATIGPKEGTSQKWTWYKIV